MERFTNLTTTTYIVRNVQEAHDFSKKVGEPEYGLVVMFASFPKGNCEIIKGITAILKRL